MDARACLAGAAETGGTVPNYRDPMVAHKNGQGLEDYHDRGSKTLLNGLQLPGLQSADEDLNAALVTSSATPTLLLSSANN